ncbi:Small ribosomal subunit biogenesis GTPase RsgA [Labeo rohita]|uniref:Small ribosomal subunit biogenesis GTPase RsgA n=1 Tax=Labeo rohita TaxID=84645 RepID=A0ABQ8MCS4_LABRO|nr:Small ribosomal subunit biogenesis GTPase RsgA [Labeo rohita]
MLSASVYLVSVIVVIQMASYTAFRRTKPTQVLFSAESHLAGYVLLICLFFMLQMPTVIIQASNVTNASFLLCSVTDSFAFICNLVKRYSFWFTVGI